jgi:RHS repeat-associated protein
MDFKKWLSPQLKPRETQSFDYREKMTAFRRAFTVMLGDQVVAQESLTVDYAYLPDGMGRVGKKSAFYSRWEGGPNLPDRTVERTTETFVLNDFYNLLDEEITTIESINGGPPAIDTVQKVYTMGPGIDYPISYSIEGATRYFFLERKKSISAIIGPPESISESIELDPWGIIIESGTENNKLFQAREFEIEADQYYFRHRNYSQQVGRFSQGDLLFAQNKFIAFANNPN